MFTQLVVCHLISNSTPFSPPFSYHLFSQDDHIQGTASEPIAAKFKSLLHEGNVYVLSNFTVQRVDKGYRAVTNDYLIRLNAWTKIVLVPGPVPQINAYKFEFVAFEQVYLRHPDNIQLCGKTYFTHQVTS